MNRESFTLPVDGVEVAGCLDRPPLADGPVPCVVLMHGLSATRDVHLDHYCERFAEAGMGAVAFDFRHFGSSGGEPRQLIDLRRQYEDIDAVLAHVRESPGIDPERVVVWGTSFAGGHALDAAARHPWVAAAICQTPFVDGAARPPGMTAGKRLWAMRVATRDSLHRALRRRPYLVPAVGPPGSNAVITSEDAYRDVSRFLPEHSKWRNEVAARFFFQLPKHRPITRAPQVGCPLLVQTVDRETVIRNDRAVRAAREAPRGANLHYSGLHHFEIYVGKGFDRLVADQIAFLREVLS